MPDPSIPPAAPAPLTVWCNYKLSDAASKIVGDGLRGHRLVFSPAVQESNLVAAPPDPALGEADVAFGQPDPVALAGLPRLKWVHLTTAGYERYDRPDLRDALRRRGAALTNSSGVYDEPCAEHALAFMLAHARQLPAALEVQRADRSWPSAPLRAGSRLLSGQSVLLLGFGAIARRLVELLAPFGMRVVAVRRSPKGDEGIPTFAESEVDRLLPEADHVVNVLPGGAPTQGFVGADQLARMKPSAAFYNIGRGSTVDGDALRAALEAGRLGAAYLDVTQPEPLPRDHPLWTTPRCYITPHTAGGHADERERLAYHFVENLRRFESGRALVDRVM